MKLQRGAAILVAMIIVTLVSTMAATMVWQQWRSVQVEAAERVRAQATWILAGALDYARLILREDDPKVDHLGEPWAVPLAESRLSTFLAADGAGDTIDAGDGPDDGPEAFLSGTISDANARYNLTNLVSNSTEPLAALVRLCDSVGVSAGVAQQIALDMAKGLIANGTMPATAASAVDANVAAAPLAPQSVDQLSWFGIDAQTIKLLEPLVVILPAQTQVNVNTASKEVLAAVVPGLDLGTAQRIVQQRQSKPYRLLSELPLSADLMAKATTVLTVSTNYFEVTGRLRLNDKVLEERSLVQRSGRDIVPIQRHRLSSIDPAG